MRELESELELEEKTKAVVVGASSWEELEEKNCSPGDDSELENAPVVICVVAVAVQEQELLIEDADDDADDDNDVETEVLDENGTLQWHFLPSPILV